MTRFILPVLLLLIVSFPASAVDVKVQGAFDVGFGFTENATFYKSRHGDTEDRFIARHRIRVQTDFVASETLRAVLGFQIGPIEWGMNNEESIGGQLDSDGKSVGIRRAYLDWTPHDPLSIRMGIQDIALPSATFGNPVLDSNVAGIVASWQFSDTVTLSSLWVRPFDEYAGDPRGRRLKDETDAFALILPLSFEDISVTPWAMYARSGADSGFWRYRSDDAIDNFDGGSTLWWGGTAVELKLFSPISIKLDAMYGSLSGKDALETQGWLAASLIEYSTDSNWGVPGLLGWYASGDRSGNASSGRHGKFGRLPIFSNFEGGFGATSLALPGSQAHMRDSLLSNSGVGTWAAGVQLSNTSFMEQVNHTTRVVYMQGTNDHSMVRRLREQGIMERYGAPINIMGDSIYLTDKDQLVEVNFDTQYTVNDNLDIWLQTAYITLDLNGSTWGEYKKTSDVWSAQLLFMYSF